jgi:hypothetical protein
MDISLKNDADETLPIALLVIRTPKVGEWVLAVETVQLNINSNSWYCSAKARDLGSNGIYTIFQDRCSCKPGNSGGA